MRHLIVILLFLLSINLYASKRVIKYGILIEKADLIVGGEISSIHEGRYVFKIDDWLKGSSSKKVSINIWEEWTCDSRIQNHKVGQRLILILTKADGIGFDIFNQSTGELFIYSDNSVRTFQNPILCDNVDTLKAGIRTFDKSFDFVGKIRYDWKNKGERYFKRLISKNEIEKKIKENVFFKWIVAEIKHYDIK